MQVTLEHVTHTYQPDSPFQATAIRDVNMVIQPGEFLALIGHTGSGKSTLAQHINGLLKPTEGRVLLDGQDIHQKGFDKKALRRKVGLVFQYPEHQLFEETVAKDVAFGPKNLGLDEKEIEERVIEALARVGLTQPGIAQKSPFELSGGQMRRVAIAGVLAMEPKVLILDEPTAGLDPAGRERILRKLMDYRRETEGTVLLISHSMDDVARLATRLLVFDKGRIAMDGTPAEIFARAEELKAMGLTVPAATEIALALRQRGVDIPESIYTINYLRKQLVSLREGGGAC